MQSSNKSGTITRATALITLYVDRIPEGAASRAFRRFGEATAAYLSGGMDADAYMRVTTAIQQWMRGEQRRAADTPCPNLPGGR